MLDISAAEQLYTYFRQNALLCGAFLSLIVLAVALHRQLVVYTKFAYVCFFKPLNIGNSAEVQSLSGQQRTLEAFYRTQASIYDATRSTLLRGREDMLQLAAAQLKHRCSNGSVKPIWVDVSHDVHVRPRLDDDILAPGRRRHRVQHREDELVRFCARVLLCCLSCGLESVTVRGRPRTLYQAGVEERPRYLRRRTHLQFGPVLCERRERGYVRRQ